MLKALLMGTALTFAAAVPLLAQTAPTTQPGQTTQPSQPVQVAPPPMAPPASVRPNAPAARLEGSQLIGLTLRNAANESIGEIEDVIVDNDGRIRQVVVGVGGFLGIGERRVSLNWDQLRFAQDRRGAVVSMTKDQLRAMPEYRREASVRPMSPSTATSPSTIAPSVTPSRAPAGSNAAPASRTP